MCKLYDVYEWVVYSLKSQFYAKANNSDQSIDDNINTIGELSVAADSPQEAA